MFLALAATLFVAPVDHLGESLTGLHLAQPLARTSLLGAAFSAQELLRRLVGSTERGLWTRMRVVAFGAGGLLLWRAFVLGSIDGATEFGSRGAATLWPAVFIFVFLVVFGFAVAEVMLGCCRYARTAHGPLAVGLRLIVNGCGFALGYVAVKFVAEALALIGSPIPFRVEAVLGQLRLLWGTGVGAGTVLLV